MLLVTMLEGMKEPNGGWSATYAVCGGCRICGVLMGPAAEADERRAAFIQHVRGPGPEHLLHSHLPHEEGAGFVEVLAS